MERCPLWQPNSRSASQEMTHLLWNPNVHYRVHNSTPPVPILSYRRPIHTLPTNIPKNHLILSFHLRPALPSGLFFRLSNQNYVPISRVPHALCMPRPSHRFLLNLYRLYSKESILLNHSMEQTFLRNFSHLAGVNFPVFYGTQMFIAVFTTARHCTVS
jgi:hypothetical protein